MLTFILKHRLILFAFSLLALFLLLLFSSLLKINKTGSSVFPTPTLYPQSRSQRPVTAEFISPLQEAEINKPLSKSGDDLFAHIVQKEQTERGMVYTFGSPVASRSNIIITDSQNKVIFERIMTPEVSTEIGYALLSQYIAKFGPAEKIVTGSKTFGWFMQTHIYAAKGFAIIANPNTDEIYEFHKFSPMSVKGYIASFGEDIDENMQPAQE